MANKATKKVLESRIENLEIQLVKLTRIVAGLVKSMEKEEKRIITLN